VEAAEFRWLQCQMTHAAEVEAAESRWLQCCRTHAEEMEAAELRWLRRKAEPPKSHAHFGHALCAVAVAVQMCRRHRQRHLRRCRLVLSYRLLAVGRLRRRQHPNPLAWPVFCASAALPGSSTLGRRDLRLSTSPRHAPKCFAASPWELAQYPALPQRLLQNECCLPLGEQSRLSGGACDARSCRSRRGPEKRTQRTRNYQAGRHMAAIGKE
jgi:hypothetical protein